MTLIIGHAGAGVHGTAPENTLIGARQALAAGVDGMEIDVHLSADGVPVVIHDATVDRTTNLRGQVRELSLVELQAADCGAGQHIPSLAEILELVAGRCTVLCELKVAAEDGRGDDALVRAVLQVIDAHQAHRWCAVHSFDGAVIKAARLADPRVSAALIVGNVDLSTMERMVGAVLRRHGQAISVQHNCITPAHVALAKRRQLTLWCWAADGGDNVADWRRLVAAGVDGIMTDTPDRLRKFLTSELSTK